jgi:hypothetical protein
MRKFLATMMVVALSLTMTACGKDGDKITGTVVRKANEDIYPQKVCRKVTIERIAGVDDAGRPLTNQDGTVKMERVIVPVDPRTYDAVQVGQAATVVWHKGDC